MVTESDLLLPDGRTVHAYDTTGSEGDARLPVFWHHGTPNSGAPPEPLFAAAEERGIRWVSFDRPGYAGSTPLPGRDLASVASDTRAVADALGIDRFAVVGHSGGSPHALACAALLPDRVVSAACFAGMAPFSAEGLDWFVGMYPGGRAELQTAIGGREALAAQLDAGDYDPEMFTPSDLATLSGEWSWFDTVVTAGLANGRGGMIDDDLAYVRPWGFDPTTITVPVLLAHGTDDRVLPIAHSRWLAQHCPTAELVEVDAAGHLSVLSYASAALDWITAQA